MTIFNGPLTDAWLTAKVAKTSPTECWLVNWCHPTLHLVVEDDWFGLLCRKINSKREKLGKKFSLGIILLS
jgi:hypothetical protein